MMMNSKNSAKRLNIALVCILGLGLFFGYRLQKANQLDKRLLEIRESYNHLHLLPDELLKELHIATIHLEKNAIETKDHKHVINLYGEKLNQIKDKRTETFNRIYELHLKLPEHHTHENLEGHKLNLMDLLIHVESELDILFSHEEYTHYEKEITAQISTCDEILNYLNQT